MSTLFVDRRGVELEYDAGALVFRENGERIGTIPMEPIKRVFLRGSVRMSASLLGQLGKRGTGVVILSGRNNTPTLMLARPHQDAQRRITQINMSQNPHFCLQLARSLVAGKLQRQIKLFDELRDQRPAVRYPLTRALQQLDEQMKRLDTVRDIASLRGMEGAAAMCYFIALRHVVPDSLNFTTRNRRPPRDPFNALLSLTYTLVHNELAIALFAVGLDPYIGFYHTLEHGRESLASDLLELLRPACDRFCLDLISKATLTEAHFSMTESTCLLGKAGRIRYYEAYESNSKELRQLTKNAIEILNKRLGLPPQEQGAEIMFASDLLQPDDEDDNDADHEPHSATQEPDAIASNDMPQTAIIDQAAWTDAATLQERCTGPEAPTVAAQPDPHLHALPAQRSAPSTVVPESIFFADEDVLDDALVAEFEAELTALSGLSKKPGQ